MKTTHTTLIAIVVCFILFAYSGIVALAEDTMILPSSLQIIEEEAFYGSSSISRVVLSDNVKEIHSRAFANSALTEINLPASLTFIAEDAFDGPSKVNVIVNSGTYAYDWAVSHNYIKEACPVEGSIYNFAGMNNRGHYFEYGGEACLSARLTSTIALKKIKASVVYRGGVNDGQKACKDIVVFCGSNIFSFDTDQTNMEYGIDCSTLPCGPLKLLICADLVDGNSYTVCEYDFEIVNGSQSVNIENRSYQLSYGEVSQISATIEPQTATYSSAFHYLSSNADIIEVDDSGKITALNKSGKAFVTVYSWDWFAEATCEVIVRDPQEPADCPVTVEVTTNVGFGNAGKFHPYGTGRKFSGTISSTVAIERISSAVVYRGGDNDGQSAYDCSNAVVTCGNDVHSVDIESSNLNTYLKFGSMPCASLTMYLYAELADGSSWTIYEYDFEIVKPCESIHMESIPQEMFCGETAQIITTVDPANATYGHVYHYESSDPDIVQVDQDGLLTASDNPGIAVITVTSGDEMAYDTKVIVVRAEPEVCPVTINVTSNAGLNDNGFHPYQTARRFGGTITSTMPILKISPEIVYRDFYRFGESAYDCSQAVLEFEEGVYNIDIASSNLNWKLSFGSLPCALYRMYLYADVLCGDKIKTFQIYEYDFEVVKKSTAISLNCNERWLRYGEGFWISPTVSPKDATYVDTFHFESDNPDVVSVDDNGYVQAKTAYGLAKITVYTWDWFAQTTITVRVTNAALDIPVFIDYYSAGQLGDGIYDTVFLNFWGVNDADYYEITRSSSANGIYEEVWEGTGVIDIDMDPDGYYIDWQKDIFTSGLTARDSDCEIETKYFYRIRARSNDGKYSEYSEPFKADSTVVPVYIKTDDLIINDSVDDSSGQYLVWSGKLKSNYEISRVTATITNKWGTVVTDETVRPNAEIYQIKNFKLDMSDYENGYYWLVLSASAAGDTQIIAEESLSVHRTQNVTQTTTQFKQDVVSYAQNHSFRIFNPPEKADEEMSNMSTTAWIAIAYSDGFEERLNGKIEDSMRKALTKDDYEYYKVLKYEKFIVELLDEMNKEGKIDEIQLSTDEANFIKSLNSIVKQGTSFRIKEISEVYESTKLQGNSGIDWDEWECLTIIQTECDELDFLFSDLEADVEMINVITEMIVDHSKDLKVLNIIESNYNPDSDPNFTAALNKIRNSYKTRFGAALRKGFNLIHEKLNKTVSKLTKELISSALGYYYKIPELIMDCADIFLKISEAGKNTSEFIVQYNTLKILQEAYENARNEILDSYSLGIMPTDEQIEHFQVTFIAARQALIQLDETRIKTDYEYNEAYFAVDLERAKNLTMPGVAKITDEGVEETGGSFGGGGFEGGGSR